LKSFFLRQWDQYPPSPVFFWGLFCFCFAFLLFRLFVFACCFFSLSLTPLLNGALTEEELATER